MLNGLGLMMIGLRMKQNKSKLVIFPLSLLMIGTVLFSGNMFYGHLT